MPKIAVIGDRETVMGFKALGLSTFISDNLDEARATLRGLTRAGEDYQIIYIEETFAAGMQAEIDRFKDSPSPAIILIPGKDGPLGLGQMALKSAVERAVGADIL